jgi:hypothetical protein
VAKKPILQGFETLQEKREICLQNHKKDKKDLQPF